MKKFIEILALIILIVVISVTLIMTSDFLMEKLLLPSDYLFYEHTPLCSFLLAYLLVIPSLFVSYYIVYYFKKKFLSIDEDYSHIVSFGKKLGILKFPIILLWVLITYACFTSLTCVTNDGIVVITPLDLKGEVYNYSDVEKIETGFGDKKFAFVEYKKEGSFYYKITVNDREVVFNMPGTNPDIERYSDTYLELEEFDQALCKHNIPKESSSDGYEKCNFDKKYVDRFLRIIESN